MATNDIGDWYRGIPRITKYWFTGSVVVPIAARFGLLGAQWLILVFELVVYKFQVIVIFFSCLSRFIRINLQVLCKTVH